MVPESARVGEETIEHSRGGCKESSSESSDSMAAKTLFRVGKTRDRCG
jgi:hypothetical protein